MARFVTCGYPIRVDPESNGICSKGSWDRPKHPEQPKIKDKRIREIFIIVPKR
jgi:hypothetical protein